MWSKLRVPDAFGQDLGGGRLHTIAHASRLVYDTSGTFVKVSGAECAEDS